MLIRNCIFRAGHLAFIKVYDFLYMDMYGIYGEDIPVLLYRKASGHSGMSLTIPDIMSIK
jgi:hypothetical protein